MEAYLESLGTRGPALFAVAGLFALAYLIGRPWVRRDPDLGAADKAFLALVLGFDLLAVLTVPLGAAGLLGSVPLRAVFALAIGIVVVLLFAELRRRRPSSFPWHVLVFVALAVVFLCHGLCYPFSWDDLVYQVTVPWRWHETNSVQVFPDLPYSGFPGAFALLNLLLIDAGGVLAPGVFNAGLWLLLALELVALLGPHLGRGSRAIFALSFALSWPALIEAISAYAELFLALQLAAIACLWLRTKASTTRVQVQLGFLAGAAASIKLTGMIVPLLAALLLAGGAWLRAPRSARTVLARVAAFSAPVLVLLAIFYSRPALATGNPLHPYFASWFTADEAAVESSVYHHDAGTARFGVPLELSAAAVGRFLSTPFALALGPFSDMAAFDGQIGLQFGAHFVLLAYLALARLRGRAPGREHSREPWVLLAGACALYAFWFLTSQQARFLMPACFLLTLAASFAWPHLARVPRIALSAALPVLALVSIPRDNYHLAARAIGVQTGAVSPLEYIDFANPDRYVYACQGILEKTPPDARVLLLFEQRGLYVPRAYRIGTPFFQGRYFTPSERTRTREEFLAVLAEERITHVLVGYNPNDPDRMERYLERTRPFQELILSLVGRELEVVFELKENDGQTRHGLYEVAAR